LGWYRGTGNSMAVMFVAVFCLALLALAVFIALSGKEPQPAGPDGADKVIISPEAKRSDLYREIEEKGADYRIKPVDAVVDPVWKAIPGYNGLEIDVDASYLEMVSAGKFDHSKIVFRQLAPGVKLDDLDPQPIYRGNPEKPMVAFLINVAWGNEYIPSILETLAHQQVKATFFFDGSWVKRNPGLTVTIYNHNHEIGNHAYSHPDLKLCSEAKIRSEISKTNETIEDIVGVKPLWFAPPSGSFNELTVQIAHQLGLKTILWTVDTVDWKDPEPAEMVRRVVSQVEKGSMVLMHPTKPTVEGLEAMITEIKQKGYHFGTVSDLMAENRIADLLPEGGDG
jgi:probable sporulation protein (polysaccharide deacetylase family)